MVDLNPPRPPWLVVEDLGTGQLPEELVEARLGWFQDTKEDCGMLLAEWHKGRGVLAFLIHLASRVDPVSGFSRITLLGVDWDGMVKILHL